MAFHELFNFTNQRPAHVFNFINILGLAQFCQHRLKDNAEFFVLADGLEHLLTKRGLQLLYIITAGFQFAAIDRIQILPGRYFLADVIRVIRFFLQLAAAEIIQRLLSRRMHINLPVLLR